MKNNIGQTKAEQGGTHTNNNTFHRLRSLMLLPLLLMGSLFNAQAQAAVTVKLTSPAANTTVAAPGSFVLTATATSSTSTIKSVSFYQGTTLLKTVTASPYTYTWSNVAAGTYSLTAKATDNKNATATSTAVSVKSVTDNGPTVSLTSPANNTASAAPASFTLTATASSTVTTISKVDFYNGATLLQTVTAAPYSFTWSNVPAGSYGLTAKATDALGKATTSTAVTVISNAPPAVSITSPANNTVAVAPASFTLTANASGTASTIAKVEFYNGTTLLGTVTAAPYTYTWTGVAAGAYSITAKATDAAGVATTSTAVNVISDAPPTVSLTSPANNAVAIAPASFTLTANASSSTSTIAKVEFYNGATLLGTATAAPYTYTWTGVAAGTYSITAKATDAAGVSSTLAPVNVAVNNGEAMAYYIHVDHLDTPRQITDSAGNIVWQWDNTDPYGNNMPNENPSGLGAFKFNLRNRGQYSDAETSLFYNINRYYDSATGRYTQSDLIGLRGGINTYTYVGNNPMSWDDPFGLRALTACESTVLKPYFPNKDLNKIDIQEGIPWLARKFGAEGADAWTFGNTIYMASGIDQPNTIDGVSLIGHEVVHSTQYDQYGAIVLAIKYNNAYNANLEAGMSPYDAYRNNPFEVAGWDMGAKIKDDLKSNPKGMNCECTK